MLQRWQLDDSRCHQCREAVLERGQGLNIDMVTSLEKTSGIFDILGPLILISPMSLQLARLLQALAHFDVLRLVLPPARLSRL